MIERMTLAKGATAPFLVSDLVAFGSHLRVPRFLIHDLLPLFRPLIT